MATKADIQQLRKQLISATGDKDKHQAVSILKRLKAQVVATDELLRETKIGITVNKLRNNDVKEVADLAKELVRKWKGDVGQSGSKKTTTAAAGSASTSTAPSPSPAATPASPAPKASPALSASSSAAPSAPAPEITTTVTTTTTTTPSAAAPSPPAPASSGPGPAPPVRRQSSGGPPRTHKSDGVRFNDGSKGDTGDKTREKCCELIYDALAQDSGAPSDLIFQRARALEKHVWTQNPPPGGTATYRNKMRSFYLNLKAANNPSLREDVVSGEISVVALYEMDPKDMASDERKAENRKLVAENLFKAQAAAPQQAETDAFQCGKCKQRRCMYYQTRSADEPMTTFVTCLSCQNRWKFS
ncbi:transcription elongation factor [Rhodotorula diobovata]|uniref:Transcription elongation factor n=1 Tax=Rhodotorula diobovata TaxID=5288 RepID=A0A5C5G628_9BASI|nr:transcription elongation factor [Rhodotorula diobovata]